ncbi:MAG: signal peptide peptidase SppA [Rikenellaceae bacterium]|nr:signal peptide peptidase SppA [Rikenellaceae bacterium]
MKFWKIFSACLLAIVICGVALWFGFAMLVGGAMMMLQPSHSSEIKPSSVLQLDLGRVTDTPVTSVWENIDPETWEIIPTQSTLQIINAISMARVDDNIKGIYIHFGDYTSISAAGLEEVRGALQAFREEGKMVVAYEDSYSQLGYWLASVSDKVFLNPQGSMEWVGLCSEVMFFKGLLDKLDINPQIIRHGTFKAAVEPFTNDKMSEANRTQTQMLVNSMWEAIVTDVAVSRSLTPYYLQLLADNISINTASDALSYGLVDGLMYESEVLDFMARAMEDTSLLAPQTSNITPEEEVEMTIPTVEQTPTIVQTEVPTTLRDVNIIHIGDYVAMLLPKTSENKIAVIYAEGDIVSGGATNALGDSDLRKSIQQAAEDDDIKAVVLRVNSPGGSALAAEQMWYELERLRQVKPLIVSMGATAASGGYYISAPADAILANRVTVTGSIGVFGMFFDMGDALSNKLGITVDGVESNSHSDIGQPFRPMSRAEQQYFQNSVDNVYTTFVSRVATGRNMSYERVDAIAEGRVWSGADARKIGLVDDIGGLVSAINIAADRAGVASDFQIVEITNAPTGITQLFTTAKASLRQQTLREELGILYEPVSQIRQLSDKTGIRAEMPYSIIIR